MSQFTPISAAIGGVLIALALALMLITTGRIAGLSGVVAGVLRGPDRSWRLAFLAAALAVGACFQLAAPATYDAGSRVPLWLCAVSGLLVGMGTRWSNGCTSGHGLCGTSRLSKRSIIATGTFFVVAVATATITGRLV